METKFININELAVYLNVKVKTIYAIVRSGKIPHYRIGRLIRFKKEDIDTWMEGNRVGKKEDAEIPVRTHKKGVRQRKSPTRDIDRIIKKTIDQVNQEEYTSSRGKPDLKGSKRKEVNNGII